MNRPTSTRDRPAALVCLLLFAGLLLCGMPASAQDIKVISAVPDMADQGTVGLVVTIGGENFGKGSRVDFFVTGTTNPGGIAVKSVKYKNPKTLEATVDVAPDAQTELKFDIQVMSNGRTGKGTELFKVNVKVTCESTDRPIVYTVRGVHAREDLMLMARDGTCQQLLLAGTKTVSNTWPAWSPAGDWIAFARNGESGGGVWVIKPDGTGLSKVVDTCNFADEVAWSPAIGGRHWIAYGDTCPGFEGAENLWAVEVSLGTPVLVGDRICLTCAINTDPSTYWDLPAWSSSGTYLAARKGSTAPPYSASNYILKVAFDSVGSPSLVLNSLWPWLILPSERFAYAWAHWSDSLGINRDGDIWRLDFDFVNQTVQETPLSLGNSYHVWNPRWSPDDLQFIAEIAIPGQLSSQQIAIISFPPTFSSIQRGGFHPDWRP